MRLWAVAALHEAALADTPYNIYKHKQSAYKVMRLWAVAAIHKAALADSYAPSAHFPPHCRRAALASGKFFGSA